MFTIGPWKMGKSAGGSRCVRENGRCNDEIAIICAAEGRTLAEKKANARLIAAAPELLEACKMALDCADTKTTLRGEELNKAAFVIREVLRDAIAKAEKEV